MQKSEMVEDLKDSSYSKSDIPPEHIILMYSTAQLHDSQSDASLQRPLDSMRVIRPEEKIRQALSNKQMRMQEMQAACINEESETYLEDSFKEATAEDREPQT